MMEHALTHPPQKLSYTLLVLASPHNGSSNLNALRFTEATLRAGHRIERIFFMGAAVDTGLISNTPAQDELNLLRDWSALAKKYPLELIVCISSALRHGVLDDTESRRHERPATLHPAFSMGGLGLLVEATGQADRLLTFGPETA
ncbi:MAG: sulfurtransferase complex subunit TusD [Parahaliea sp.]